MEEEAADYLVHNNPENKPVVAFIAFVSRSSYISTLNSWPVTDNLLQIIVDGLLPPDVAWDTLELSSRAERVEPRTRSRHWRRLVSSLPTARRSSERC